MKSLRAQLRALDDAETVLFVDHDETERLERDPSSTSA